MLTKAQAVLVTNWDPVSIHFDQGDTIEEVLRDYELEVIHDYGDQLMLARDHRGQQFVLSGDRRRKDVRASILTYGCEQSIIAVLKEMGLDGERMWEEASKEER